ncbi:hypothetical protein F9X03_19710 [Salmonella enterica]|nr:hypothetical protein [Salmonella enterica]
MVMQQRYFKLNEVDSVKYHKEYQEQIGKPRKKAIRDFYPEKKALVVRIPVGESGEKPLPADMSPALIEIKRSEFIAVTEE